MKIVFGCNFMKNTTNKNGKEFYQGCISFEDFKRSLGVEVNNYNDEQIEQIRVTFDMLADRFFDDWLYKRNNSIM
jgi:hypothetical protein